MVPLKQQQVAPKHQLPGTFAAVIDWPSDDGNSRPVSVTVHVLENLQQPVLCTATERLLGMLHDGYLHARVN